MANIVRVHLNGGDRVDELLTHYYDSKVGDDDSKAKKLCEKLEKLPADEWAKRGEKAGREFIQKRVKEGYSGIEALWNLMYTIEFDDGTEYVCMPLYDVKSFIDAFMGEE